MSIIRDSLRRLRSASVAPPAPATKPSWPAYPGLAPTAAPAPPAKPASQSSAGPKTKPRPKPQPKPKPPAQPVAATAKSTPDPKLPFHGAQLPAVPLTVADVPQAAKAVSGTLLRDADPKSGRPLVMICTPCTCSRRTHHYPWRSDWPVDASVRSHQQPRCKKHKGPDGVWLAIDSGRVGRSLQAVREMREALCEWKAQKASKRTPAPQETANVHSD